MAKTSRMLRITGIVVLTCIAVPLLLLATFAMPIPLWRSGELPVAPLSLQRGGPAIPLSNRIWIDTDAACGQSPRTDPDDCFALLLMAPARGKDIIGISTVHGNAALEVTDRTTRDLVEKLEIEGGVRPVYRGAADPIDDHGPAGSSPAATALQNALAAGPLTLVALGPLTNIAAALEGRRDLQRNVRRLIMVMGKRPGHLFHPAEGAGKGMLFGHGPVFRDFNFDMDRRAAILVMQMALPTTLIPYDAARTIILTAADLAHIETANAAADFVASRARGWLRFWRDDVGLDGFYPFDLLAAAYVLDRRNFDCAETNAWIGKDPMNGWAWIHNPDTFVVDPDLPTKAAATARVIYCPDTDAELHAWLMARLAAAGDVQPVDRQTGS